MTGWPKVALGDLLKKGTPAAALDPAKTYRELTVRLWGKGILCRGTVLGSDVGTPRRVVSKNQLVISKIDARHGAAGLVPEDLDGAVVSNDFPTYSVNDKKAIPEFVGWLAKSAAFVEMCRRASAGTTNRVRLNEEKFLSQEIRLPPPTEQERVTRLLETARGKALSVVAKLDAAESDGARLLAVSFRDTLLRVRWLPMAEVAPLVRREAAVELEGSYPELGVRSFGKGTFHKPALAGADVGTKRLYEIKEGDLIFSNVFAWEGAIAVAKAEDDGRYGSHRFITCVPTKDLASAEYLRYFFLSPDGMDLVRAASPGGAGRNKTLGIGKLAAIKAPVPSPNDLLAFEMLSSKIVSVTERHAQTRATLDHLIPSLLERVFGDLVFS